MLTQFNVFKAWLHAKLHVTDERGANLVEYILLVAFIALVVVLAVTALQGAISTKFNGAKDCLNNSPNAC